MPTVFKHNGFRFFFYSNGGNPREAVHIHVMKDDFEAKFWLKSDVELAKSYGFDAKTLGQLAKIVGER